MQLPRRPGSGYPSGRPGPRLWGGGAWRPKNISTSSVWGSEADWEAGRGSFYYIEDKNGEKCIPVFTSPERADRFAQANFNNPEAPLQMLESIGVVHAPALTSGRFIVMPLRAEGLARAAAMVEADYLVRDPRPGDQQDIMRVPK